MHTPDSVFLRSTVQKIKENQSSVHSLEVGTKEEKKADNIAGSGYTVSLRFNLIGQDSGYTDWSREA